MNLIKLNISVICFIVKYQDSGRLKSLLGLLVVCRGYSRIIWVKIVHLVVFLSIEFFHLNTSVFVLFSVSDLISLLTFVSITKNNIVLIFKSYAPVTLSTKLSINNYIFKVNKSLRILTGQSLLLSDHNYSHSLPNRPNYKYCLFKTF